MRGNRDRVGSIDLRHLVDHDHVAEEIEACSAQLLRPWNPEESQLSHLLDVRPRKLCLRVELRRDRCYLAARELAHHVAYGEVLLGKVKGVVHRSKSGATCSPPPENSRGTTKSVRSYRCADTFARPGGDLRLCERK